MSDSAKSMHLKLRGDVKWCWLLAEQVSLKVDQKAIQPAGSAPLGKEHATGSQEPADEPCSEEVRRGVQDHSLLNVVMTEPEEHVEGVKDDPAP